MQSRKVLLLILGSAMVVPYACVRQPPEPTAAPPLPMTVDPYQNAVFLLSPYLDETFLGKGMSNGNLSPSATFACGNVLHCKAPDGGNIRTFTTMKSSSVALSGLFVSIGSVGASADVETYVEYKVTESKYVVLAQPLYNKASDCCRSDGTPDTACQQGYAFKAWYGKGSYKTYTRIAYEAGAGAKIAPGVEVFAVGGQKYAGSQDHTFVGYFALYLDDAGPFCRRAKNHGLLSVDATNYCSLTASPADSSRFAYVEPLPDAGPPLTEECRTPDGGPP